MKQLLAWLGISKQSNHQYLQDKAARMKRTYYYIGLIVQARELHPVIGLSKIYALFAPQGIGRDAFVALGMKAGFGLEPYIKTTFSTPSSAPYANLLVSKTFNDINQLWTTDITYFAIGDTFFYLIFILDVYSRKIVGFCVADSLHAKYNIQALTMAIKQRKIVKNTGLIHHSDRGSQYSANAYTAILDRYQIAISMCNSVFENTHIERVNGIIKNNYLKHWQPRNLDHLKVLTKTAVNNYNNCPHSSLGKISPNAFELLLPSIPMEQRTKMSIYTTRKRKVDTLDPNQLELCFEG